MTRILGGTDHTSQYLLGLVGLGIPGSAAHIGMPVSRFLALLGVLRLPTRTAEGISALGTLLAPQTAPSVTAHDPLRVPLASPATLSCRRPIRLASNPILGRSATDVNSQVLVTLKTSAPQEALNWLPGGQLHTDFLALLHVYLGTRLHARLKLTVPRALLPDAQLSCHVSPGGAQLGRTAAMKRMSSAPPRDQQEWVSVSLGRYQGVVDNPHDYEAEDGDYKY